MIQIFAEPMLPAAVQDQLPPLLDEAFPGFFNGRTYVKQQPHFRIVMHSGSHLIAHVALDYRVIRIGAEIVRICGVIDLCVRKDRRGQGTGSQLLERAEVQAREAEVCFMVLMADHHDLYTRHGFVRIQAAATRWLAIEDRASHSLTEQDLSDCFMAKPLTNFGWPEGPIDLLAICFEGRHPSELFASRQAWRSAQPGGLPRHPTLCRPLRLPPRLFTIT